MYITEPITLTEKQMFVKGFFLGVGSPRTNKLKPGVKYCRHLNNLDFNSIEKLQRFSKKVGNDTILKYML